MGLVALLLLNKKAHMRRKKKTTKRCCVTFCVALNGLPVADLPFEDMWIPAALAFQEDSEIDHTQGNFRALLQFIVSSKCNFTYFMRVLPVQRNDINVSNFLQSLQGDNVLKKHMESCAGNVMYLTAPAQNQLIECIGKSV